MGSAVKGLRNARVRHIGKQDGTILWLTVLHVNSMLLIVFEAVDWIVVAFYMAIQSKRCRSQDGPLVVIRSDRAANI